MTAPRLILCNGADLPNDNGRFRDYRRFNWTRTVRIPTYRFVLKTFQMLYSAR